MSGEALIWFIESNHLEDYEIEVYRQGLSKESIYGYEDIEIDNENKTIIF